MIDLIVWMFFFSFLMLLARFGSFTWVGLWAWRGGEEALGLENFEVWGGGGRWTGMGEDWVCFSLWGFCCSSFLALNRCSWFVGLGCSAVISRCIYVILTLACVLSLSLYFYLSHINSPPHPPPGVYVLFSPTAHWVIFCCVSKSQIQTPSLVLQKL